MLVRQIALVSDRSAVRSKKKERRRAASLDGFGDIPRRNETALMQVLKPDYFMFMKCPCRCQKSEADLFHRELSIIWK